MQMLLAEGVESTIEKQPSTRVHTTALRTVVELSLNTPAGLSLQTEPHVSALLLAVLLGSVV